MGPVAAVAQSIKVGARRGVVPGAAATAAPAEPGRALVPLNPGRRHSGPGGRAASAPFLTQLLAAKHNLPQARERGRASPREATAAYLAVARVTRGAAT